jgi:tetratricopeptide (TPR) repeat protein
MTRTTLPCAPLAVLLFTSPVLADNAKKATTKPMADMAKVPVPTRPVVAPKPEERTAPTLTLDEFVGRKQEAIQKINDKQIAYLQSLIKLASPDDPQLPDYLFRLGELLAEKYRYWDHRARALDEAIFRAGHGEDESSLLEPRRQEQGRDRQQAEHALRMSVAQLTATAKYPSYPRMDEVLYRLGYLLQAAGRARDARLVFHRLLKEHPQSRYVPDAYLAFADDAFAKGDMPQALGFYAKVTKFPESSVFGFALYKRAWTEANLGDPKAALGSFVALLAHCQSGKVGRGQRGPLEREARRDLVTVYARTPGADPDRALDLFRRIASDEARTMMQALAEAYWNEGMAPSSTRAYRKVMALEPRSPSLCAWQHKILRNTLSAGGEAEQVQELGRLGSTYHYLQQLGTAPRSVMDACRDGYRDAGRELAFVLHKQAQRTKQLATYALAAAAYREFLGDFEATSSEAAFYYGECLWQIATLSATSDELWRHAAEQYTHVVHLDPRGPFVKEAAYAAVLAWQNAVYQNDDDLHPHRTGA